MSAPVLAMLQDKIGQEIHASDWLEVTQQRIDAFAAATGDQQWIHTDPGAGRARVALEVDDRPWVPDAVVVPAAAWPRRRRPRRCSRA